MPSFKLEILTPEKTFFEGEAEAVIVDTIVGRVEVMARHITYASAIVPCTLRIKSGGTDKRAFVSAGLLEFKDNKAFVLVDSAEWPGDIDVKRAEESKARAEARIAAKDKDIDIGRARRSLMRAVARLKTRDVL